APDAAQRAALWADERFAAPAAAPDADVALAVSETMQRFLDEQVRPQARRVGPRLALLQGLFDRGRMLRLEYDASRTRTAAEAFDARAGNCLSLVMMTAALARELGLEVRFQRVDSAAAWTRSGGMYAYSSHVNVVLGPLRMPRHAGASWETGLTIDFLPPEDLRGHRTSAIDERTLRAMFLNNRAAEALAAGDESTGYAWARAAIEHAPGFMPAYNTLALVHWRRGDGVRAEAALRLALAGEPDNTRVLANLAALLDEQGRAADAAALRARLLALEPRAPFVDYERGWQALAEARWAEAREAFERQLRRDEADDASHFGLALAALRLGDHSAAEQHLELAARHSATPQGRQRYAAKLAALKGRSM
ncbi:MAG: hypothetical protein HYZ20_12380, partial [Burkholderiales bacterium]|nr:hypothetical protein [Burkholderiales bacterium]